VLIHEAIGEQLTCVFVDTGLLRSNEADQVVNLFRDHYNIPLVHVDAADEFLGRLEGISDPETKRKTIGGFSSRCSTARRPRSAALISWRRAPSIPTWWRASLRAAAPRR
jgi:GMP synthase (glutamine-hydrolysing)